MKIRWDILKRITKAKTKKAEKAGMDRGAAWAVAYVARYYDKSVAKQMARDWGFRTVEDLAGIDEYDAEAIRPLIDG